ncbi:NADP-dependent oxidoreductase [Streptomyces humi]
MRAIVFQEYGGPDVLHPADVEEPHAGPGQVRLKVVAASVNPADRKVRSGAMPFLVPATFPDVPMVPGVEAAGVVDEVGEGVTGVSVGDEVFGWTDTGAYAPYALAAADAVAAKPAGLDWEVAAALPVTTETASRVLDLLELKEGETVLVNGAAGSIGAMAVQLAVARGTTVIGTASPANHDYLRSLGAVPVTYGDGLADRVRALAPQGIDAVADTAGHGVLPAAIELRGGTSDRIVTIVDLPAAQEHGVTFSGQATRPADALAEYGALAAKDGLRVSIAGTFPLTDAAKAHELGEAGHTPGKLILRP